MPALAILTAVVVAYLIGSLPGSLLLAPLFSQTDVRDRASNNAGATNALRAGGRGYGLTVLIFDMVKGAVAAGLVPVLLHVGGPWPFVCGILVVLGHIYPVFYNFRGGKGAASCIGVLAVLLPGSLLFGAAIWIAVLVAFGYVSLATMLGMIGVAIASFFVHSVPPAGHLFVIVASVLIVFTHRGNIQRLRAGNENRFEQARLWRRR